MKIGYYKVVVLLFALMIIGAFDLNADKINFKNVYLKRGGILQSIPFIMNWVDGNHYIQFSVDKEGKRNKYTVDARNGKKILMKKKTKKKPSKDNKMINPQTSPDKKWIAFTRKKDLYIKNIKTGLETRITNDGSDTIFNGYASWVYYEEVLGRRSKYRAFWWSPDSKRVVFLRFDNKEVPNFTLVRSRGVHGEVEVTAYPKPGDKNPKVKMGVYNLYNKKLLWVKTGENEDKYIAFAKWNPEGTKLFYQEMNRGQDTIKILQVNLETGNTKNIYEETQKSWVEFFEDLYVLKKNRGFIVRSDKDGWRHLYLYKMNGKLKNRITRGNWRVRGIEKIDEKHKRIYFTGYRKESVNNHLFVIGFNGKGLKRLSKGNGYHRFKVSPNFRYFIDTYSNVSMPTKVRVCNIRGKLIRVIGNAKPEDFAKLKLGKAEMLKIPAEGGFNLPAKWILPPNFDKNKKYPVLFTIYGGPNNGTVYNTFNRMTSYYLAKQGIIVFAVDHRGSGHFGKKAVALMHRKLGYWEMKDYISAVKWLREKSFVDDKKIAITGGSYGGYVTCMALTKGADYFTHGIAKYSVTDWKLYDSIYTERYMDTPKENKKGYEDGSVMKYAANLKGELFILHGEVDDNVHPQNSLQLLSKLQDLNKDFQFMMYPDGRHGWGGKKRIHLSNLEMKFWFKNLLGKEFDMNKD